jgi:hypothetical protein
MLSKIDRAVVERHADAWLLWGDRDAFTADDLRLLLGELADLRRTLAAARRAAR